MEDITTKAEVDVEDVLFETHNKNLSLERLYESGFQVFNSKRFVRQISCLIKKSIYQRETDMTKPLLLVKHLDAPTEPRPQREKPRSRRDRRKEARAASKRLNQK